MHWPREDFFAVDSKYFNISEVVPPRSVTTAVTSDSYGQGETREASIASPISFEETSRTDRLGKHLGKEDICVKRG